MKKLKKSDFVVGSFCVRCGDLDPEPVAKVDTSTYCVECLDSAGLLTADLFNELMDLSWASTQILSKARLEAEKLVAERLKE